jgi:hypothetical protein
MQNKRATYYRYIGNHPEGEDRIRFDPHNFGIELISYMVSIDDYGDYVKPLTKEMVSRIKVERKKSDDFNTEIVVTASAEVWELARKSLFILKNRREY